MNSTPFNITIWRYCNENIKIDDKLKLKVAMAVILDSTKILKVASLANLTHNYVECFNNNSLQE